MTLLCAKLPYGVCQPILRMGQGGTRAEVGKPSFCFDLLLKLHLYSFLRSLRTARATSAIAVCKKLTRGKCANCTPSPLRLVTD